VRHAPAHAIGGAERECTGSRVADEFVVIHQRADPAIADVVTLPELS